MKPILTKKGQEREEFTKSVIARYEKLNVPGSHLTAIIEKIAMERGIKTARIYKAIKKYRDSFKKEIPV